jgi:NAD(P)H-dependent FMN reductase
MLILAISGSLRAGSLNTALLDAAARVAPAGVQVVRYEGMAELPAFNQDLEESPHLPMPVRDLRAHVAAADALLVSSPEYAHGMPGALKNLLDWLVGSVDFPGKPVTLVAPSERSVHAQAQLAEVLRTMSARLVPDAAVLVPLARRDMDAESIVADPQLAARLRDTLATLTRAAGARAE